MPKGTLYNTKNKNVVAVCTRHHDGNVPEFVFAQVTRTHLAHGGIYLDLKLVTPKFKYRISDFCDVNARYTTPIASAYIGELVRDGAARDCFVDSHPDDVNKMDMFQFGRQLGNLGLSQYFEHRVAGLAIPGTSKEAVHARAQARSAFRIEFEDTFTDEFLNRIESFVDGWLVRLQKREKKA